MLNSTHNMDQTERDKLIASLEKEAQVVQGELLSFAKQDPSNPDNFLVAVEENDRDPEGNASDLTELSKLTALRDALVRRLSEIRIAIEKLKKGEYGQCETCSAPIQQSRLKVMPIARFCIQCAKTKLREA